MIKSDEFKNSNQDMEVSKISLRNSTEFHNKPQSSSENQVNINLIFKDSDRDDSNIPNKRKVSKNIFLSDKDKETLRAIFIQEKFTRKSIRQMAIECDIAYKIVNSYAKEFWGDNFNQRFGIKSYEEKLKQKRKKEKFIKFLDRKRHEIINGEFLPSKRNIFQSTNGLEDMTSLSQVRTRWIKSNTPFTNYTELKSYIKGIPPYKKLRMFLNSRRESILKGNFVPSKQKIINAKPELANYPNITSVVRKWLKKWSDFENITDYKEQLLDPYITRLKDFLDMKKCEILNGDFVPDRKNIIEVRPEFSDYNNLTSSIIRWLRKNTKFDNITEWKENFLGVHIRDQIRFFLDTHKEIILNGNFIPTSKNLRKINRDFGDYENSHIIVSEWLVENSDFKNLEDMIKFLKPSKKKIGLSGTHNYTPDFLDEEFRVKNSLFQVVQILDKENLLQFIKYFDTSLKTWSQLFNFIELNSQWFFIDILTGEIITRTDFEKNRIAFHHIDGDKLNDNPKNLVFVLNSTHGFFTIAQRFDIQLDNFFINLLRVNVRALNDGEIPVSWKVGWKSIADENGIKISPKYYRKQNYNTRVFDHRKSIRDWF